MTIGCNIWMICLILIWFFYGLSRMFQLPQFVWALRSSVRDVFINFLLIDGTDRIKISSDQKLFFIALSLNPLSFFANIIGLWVLVHLDGKVWIDYHSFNFLSHFINVPYVHCYISLLPLSNVSRRGVKDILLSLNYLYLYQMSHGAFFGCHN